MNNLNISFLIKVIAIFIFMRMVFFQFNNLIAVNDSTYKYKYIKPICLKVLLKQDTLNKKILITNSIVKKDSVITIYTRLENNSQKNYATRKLYGLFFRKQSTDDANELANKTDATEKFASFAGKQINKIDLIRLEAFGQSVFDSTIKPTTWIENKVNNLHISTANFIIKNQLLFKEGDLLNPVDFTETEQLIRNLNYIEDVNIKVEPADDSTKVNIRVITKDAWSIGIDARLNNTHSSQIQIYDKNLGGLGFGLSGYLFYDTKNPSKWGHKGELSLSNIGGSFIQSNIWFREGQGFDTYALSFTRDFYASKALYGGGVGVISSIEPYSYLNIDSTSSISYSGYDYWLARSFHVSRKDLLKAPHNFVIAYRYLSTYYSKRPNVSISTNYLFQNKKYYIVGLSLAQQDLHKANLIYSFGATEDIPTGFKIQFTAGYEKGEFQDRYYLGNEFSAAEVGPWGYLFSSVRGGGFLNSAKKTQQITTNLQTIYFSNLIKIKNIKFRQFVSVDYTRGLSRFDGEGEKIFLNENYGIRGLNSRQMSGTSRLVFNIETVAFSPLYVFGFRFAYFAFCDVGFIGSADDYITENQSYTGFGLGVRIRNENLVLNTIQIRLGYYPKLPANPDVSYWLINGQQRTRFQNFRANEPSIVPFQ
ncbi:MAG: hypothetical protein HXX16_17400 [Bacteroidales bacterium]|nr:hypothetical protein [Bacteroidales bacterium]